MSRESMRKELAATLTEVGVAAPRGASVEQLVGMACQHMTERVRYERAFDKHRATLHAALREALVGLGRDPGAHALLSEMLEELVRLAQGRMIR